MFAAVTNGLATDTRRALARTGLEMPRQQFRAEIIASSEPFPSSFWQSGPGREPIARKRHEPHAGRSTRCVQVRPTGGRLP
jgi:hypothetical protein